MAKAEGRVAKRYARALFESSSPDKVEALRDALRNLSALWSESAELRAATLNPAIPASKREEIVGEVANVVLPNDKGFANFAKVLVSNRRLATLPQIAELFSLMVDELKKILSLEVASAFEISQDERSKIEERVKREFGALPKVSWRVDKSLLGGLVIKVGDKLLDSSIKGSLEKLRSELTI